jgi:hypothetical protein
MNIILRDYSCGKKLYLYDLDTGTILKNIKYKDGMEYKGYVKKRFLNKVYTFWINEDKQQIFQYNKFKYNLYSKDVEINLVKENNVKYVFSIFFHNKCALKVKYYRFLAYLDLDETDREDFDFFYFVYSVWLNIRATPNYRQSERSEEW